MDLLTSRLIFLLFSGIDLKKCSFTNYGVAEKVDRKREICSMSWVDEDESQVSQM